MSTATDMLLSLDIICNHSYVLIALLYLQKSLSPIRDTAVAPLAKMSDTEDNSPPGTYKTTVNINGGENKPIEMFNLLPMKGEEVDSGHKHTDMHVPEGMMKRVETHDKALEALANIPIHQVSFVKAQLFL